MYKANINIKSNIYIRDPETYAGVQDAPENDAEFVAEILDAEALRAFQKYTDYNMKELNISELQRKILEEKPCARNSTGEITHGIVKENGELVYRCLCEMQNCPEEHGCERHKISRNPDSFEDDSSGSTLKMLGVDENTDVFRDPEGGRLPENDAISEDESEAIAEMLADISEYKNISAEEAARLIIEADANDKIIVNAAPGAGKTYTAAERLIFLLKKAETQKPPKILVLCRTDSAADEIRARIEAKISSGELPQAAALTALGTFDVLATKYLADKGITTEELCELSYSGRISLFNEKADAKDFSDFEYCIIDELNELVNERAEMALTVLKSLKCGFLLLEDKCQAIFDYSSESGFTMDSAAFYSALRGTLSPETKKFTLLGNKRQSKNLEQMTDLLRSELLDDNRKNVSDVCRNQLSRLPQTLVAEDFRISSEDGTSAILCRRNGDAEYISWLLHKNKIPHTLIRENSAGISLGRFLADILWDHYEKTITRKSFAARFTARCIPDNEQADSYFNALCEYVSGNVSDELSCELLAEKICQGGELPAKILNARHSTLTVSTIKKAKGREFDKVYLLGCDFSPNDGKCGEEKMLYFAETRPKNELEILGRKNRWVFKQNKNNRWIRTVREAYKAQSVCVGFGTGDADDIDYNSFVDGDISDAVRKQAYISRNVKCGDEIVLKRSGDIYEIIHQNNVIGKMSKSYSENLLDEFNGRKYFSELPEQISELFVTNVITFVSYKAPEAADENIPESFRKKRFWLGVEISGFGTIEQR